MLLNSQNLQQQMLFLRVSMIAKLGTPWDRTMTVMPALGTVTALRCFRAMGRCPSTSSLLAAASSWCRKARGDFTNSSHVVASTVIQQ